MLPLLLCAAFAAPDVIFISVDTLRADRLGVYGYEYDTSPNIDRLAEQGLVFNDMVCEVPLTNPSMGAMLSSRFPRTTGAVRNGLPMPGSVPLITEKFKQQGYETIAVQSNWTLKQDMSGLDRGFDVYEDDFKKRRWGFLLAEREAEDVSDIAIKLLKKRDQDKPLFMWVHYSDPHAPYKWHKKYNYQDVKRRKLDKTEDIRVRYDSEVGYTDKHIGRLLDKLPTENTYVVFVGDHGESLMEHGYLGHGRRIYQQGMHIPFFITGPGIQPGTIDIPARGIDVGPTILALAGFDPWPGMAGVNLLVDPDLSERERVIETYGGAAVIPGVKKLMADSGPDLQGVLLDQWKLIVDGNDNELYNLKTDPREERNIAREFPELVNAFREIIRAWTNDNPASDAEGAELSDEDIEALENLGYL